MANVPISGLPPITLPLDGATTFFETSSLEAGEEVSRKVSVDNLFVGFGLDATFVTVTPNVALPNERILTAGVGIDIVDGGAGLAITVSIDDPLLLSDGSAPAPSYSFASDPDTGMFLLSGNALAFAAGGVEIARAIEAAEDQFIVSPGALLGSAGLPALAFGDGDSGFRESIDDTLNLSLGGGNRYIWTAGSFSASATEGPAVLNEGSLFNNPTLVPRKTDLDTGVASAGADQLTLVAGGVEGLRFTEASNRIIQRNANHVGLTASVTQTQAGGLVLLSSYNEVATVANTGDALTAFSVAEGDRLIVVNNGANALQLFPAASDDFGAGVNASITIAAGAVGIFIGRDIVNWDTLFNADPSGIAAGVTSFAGRTGVVVPITTDYDAFYPEIIDNEIISGNWTFTGSQLLISRLDPHFDLFATGAAVDEKFWGVVVDSSDGSWTFRTRTDADATGQNAIRLTRTGTNIDTMLLNADALSLTGDVTVSGFVGVEGVLTILDAGLTDSVAFSHDGVDFNLTSLNTRDFNMTFDERLRLVAQSVAIQEVAAAPGDEAAFGQFWVRNDIPNIPMFSDDAGTDFKLGVVNDAVQARRTTTFTLTTAFVDVTLDATDVETDAAIIEHDNVNTDDIDIKVTGTYEITYEADILTNATTNSTINADGRVRLNDLGTGINGSLGLSCAFRDTNITGNDFNSHLSVTFIANLTAGDFITLQLQKTEIGGSDVFVADEVHLQAKRIG